MWGLRNLEKYLRKCTMLWWFRKSLVLSRSLKPTDSLTFQAAVAYEAIVSFLSSARTET